MNRKPALVILAAGLGSRYGGMKQIDGVGNHGEPIIEFSIYDAKEAGFEKVYLIIRREHEDAFRRALTDKIGKKMKVEFIFQDMEKLPEGITLPEGRTKPWGTTHALLACKGIVKQPFAIINADDFYGKDAYKVIYRYLTEEISDDHYAMVGYRLGNTISENGTVTRGICQEDEDNNLTAIREIKSIMRRNGRPYYQEDGEWKPVNENSLVSMNFWGFTPKIFRQTEPLFKTYIEEHIGESPMTCEYVIPTAIGELVKNGTCSVKVLSSNDKWFGVTYKEDKPEVMERIAKMKEAGIYPDLLWQ